MREGERRFLQWNVGENVPERRVVVGAKCSGYGSQRNRERELQEWYLVEERGRVDDG